MPTYTYECKKCGQKLDRFHGMNAKPRVKCEACGGACIRLLGMGSGIIFKGSGFYETDYKRKSPEKDPATTASKSSDKEASTGKKDSASKKDSSKSTTSGSGSASEST